MTQCSPFWYLETSPEIIHLAVLMYVRFPLSLRNVEGLLHERGIEISHETVRLRWIRFGPIFAAEIRKRRVEGCEPAPGGMTASSAKIAYGTDCGMFPFSHGILEFQAMVAAGLSTGRALKAATSVAAELLQRPDLGTLEVGRQADIVAMPGDPVADILATAKVDFVMRGGHVYRNGDYDLLT